MLCSSALLRVLDAKEVMHVRGRSLHSVNVRVICASHKQLLDLVKAGLVQAGSVFPSGGRLP